MERAACGGVNRTGAEGWFDCDAVGQVEDRVGAMGNRCAEFACEVLAYCADGVERGREASVEVEVVRDGGVAAAQEAEGGWALGSRGGRGGEALGEECGDADGW